MTLASSRSVVIVGLRYTHCGRGRGGEKSGPEGSAVASGKGRRRERSGEGERIRCGAVGCQRLARITEGFLRSSRPAGGNEGGCSTLAVVSAGSGMVRDAKVAANSQVHPRPSQAGHLDANDGKRQAE